MYCGAECFETDEEMHSLICESIQNLSPQRLRDEKENEVVMVRALLFPEKADKPKFVWVGVKGDNPVGLVDHLGTPPVEIKFASLFSDKRVNTVRDRELKDVVKVYIQGHLEGLEDNTSILQVITLSRRWLKAEAIARAAEFTSVDGTRKRSPEREEGVELSNCYCTLPMRQPTERVELNDAVM
jgi:hypothetical protein